MRQANAPDGFTIREGVTRVALGAGQEIGAGQSGELAAEATGLKPSTKYYFRFYTIGRDSDDMKWESALQVGSFTTALA